MTLGRDNKISLIILGTVVFLLIGSAWWAATGIDAFVKMYRKRGEMSVAFPALAIADHPMGKDDYERLRMMVGTFEAVRIENRGGSLLVTAREIDDEPLWRAAVAELLALDRNLFATRVCGGDACGTGVAFLAEISGSRRLITTN